MNDMPQKFSSPFIRSPERSSTIFAVMTGAACLPLLGGIFFFGTHAIVVSLLAVASCVFFERMYYRVTSLPSLLGKGHAYLTGVLLALTLPAFTPWWAVIMAGGFAIIVGKAAFGGVGHYIWPPALIGRLSIAVLLPIIGMSAVVVPDDWPLLSQSDAILGNISNAREISLQDYQGWKETTAADGSSGFLLEHPSAALFGLTDMADSSEPRYSSIGIVRSDINNRKPALLATLPPLRDMLIGARPGGLGETSTLLIIAAGIYLIYRHYVKWQLSVAMLAAAWLTAAVAPIRLCGPAGDEIVWYPLLAEGLEVGFTYVNYQLFSGELLLCAFILAADMTSRPVRTGGQFIFGALVGALAMLMKLYINTPIPAYIAVLIMCCFTPVIDSLWRPRVLGARRSML
ncbi:MAG TPA: RnfABCDGE type electron transport complex subunit D [Phycisphaerae bacterium]|nr:RnfABCDGE type electron transport complex subunit D [Phycisphaerae bacterium]HPS53388.1 RnfABCDGE type electron transport complex subunit D [Phycisphaerae bacterium]